MNSQIRKYQKQLLEQIQYTYYKNPITEPTQKAYLATPRHLFVKRYRELGIKEWNEVKHDNLENHLAKLYEDRWLILFDDGADKILSTISHPSLVLRMLDMLQVKPGHKIFELGTGSGWNAALMGRLVGSEGHVYSLEIIPEIARMASDVIEGLDIRNVSIINTDGGEGYVSAAPYDRAIFTAGAYDLPSHFFKQMKNGSLLLIVIKIEGGGDILFLLRKNTDHFESLESMDCDFVQMMGKYQITDLDPVVLESWSVWPELKELKIARRNFWWGGKGNEYVMRTHGIRSFLSITEPLFKTFILPQNNRQSYDEQFFGLWDEENQSLVISKDDMLISYNGLSAEEQLIEDVKRWVNLGMPSAASFNLEIYPIGTTLNAGENQWIVQRKEAQFLWSLKNLIRDTTSKRM